MGRDLSNTWTAKALALNDLTPAELALYWSQVGPKDEEGNRKWTGRHDKYGYGVFALYRFDRWIDIRAHRISYLLRHGSIDPNLTIDHTCRERDCCEWECLEQKTIAANTFASPFTSPSINLAKTHCKEGHEFTPENTRIGTNGKRICVLCARDYSRKYMRKRLGITPDRQRI